MSAAVTQVLADADSHGAVEVHTNTVSASIAGGDDIYVCVAQAASVSIAASCVTDSQGHTYELHTGQTVAGTYRIGTWWCRATNGLAAGVDTITFTVRFTNTAHVTMYVLKMTGMGVIPDVDTGNDANGTGTAPSSGTSPVTAADDEVAIVMHGYTNAPTYTKPAGYTQTATTQLTTADGVLSQSISYKILTVAGAQSGVGTLSTSQDWGGTIATYKALPPELHPDVFQPQHIGVGMLGSGICR